VDAQDLFARYFLPLYPPDARERDDLARARATDANPSKNRFILAHVDDAAIRFVEGARAFLGEDLVLDGSDASVHRLSARITPERRAVWMAEGAAGSPESLLFNVTVHGAAYVGSCIVSNHAGAWGVRRPLWESVVRLRSRAGEADLAVFHWWLKALADDAQGTTLADRYRAHVEVPCARPEDLPIFVAGERPLPRLQRPRYDSLHRYLRAHLPELRDLGEHFPTPERFDRFGLRWVDAHRLGEGRMVLLVGAAPAGVHFFWLSVAGFDKSAFLPCDGFPDPVVRVEGERIVLLARAAGEDRVHEMLWWGP
jgi:hypothetical protein